mmetsp:Transcript_1420/g.146  ORF Transcript_1420/g.146 Transcript_1420/m.146 type:complete len:128 (+) Transcript_1420:67-450(+)
MEFVIIYGFIINFSVIFTLATLLGFTLAVLEIRVDAIKLTKLSKRPYPHSANTIGIWFWIMIVTNIIGAATLSGIMIFTANIFLLNDSYSRWLVFLIVEHGLLIMQFVYFLLIHGTPTQVERGIKWG